MENAQTANFDLTPAEELKRDLEIDRHALERMCILQPQIYDKYAARSADIRRKRDSLKVKIKVRSGEIATAYRNSGVKCTVDMVHEHVDSHPELAQLEYELAELDGDLNLAEGVVRALEHKKASIDNLVYLATSSYYQVSAGGNPAAVAGVHNQARQGLNNRGEQ